MTTRFTTELVSGRHKTTYHFERLNDGRWRVWKDKQKAYLCTAYIVNLKAKTCNCTAGRHSRRCKHLTEAERLEIIAMSAPATTQPATPMAAVVTITPDDREAQLAAVFIRGDLSTLGEAEKARYYMAVCEATGLNPATQPFGYIKTKNGLKLYANKNASEQLRKNHNVSLRIVGQVESAGVYTVTVEASLPNGRVDGDVGVVPTDRLLGEDRCNAIMKCVTKAKRRATLSICGLGMMDESEAEQFMQPEPPRPVITQPTVAQPVITQPPAQQSQTQGPTPASKIDREGTIHTVERMAKELKIEKFEHNLNRAYGKTTLASLTDEELSDIFKRLLAKKPDQKAA